MKLCQRRADSLRNGSARAADSFGDCTNRAFSREAERQQALRFSREFTERALARPPHEALGLRHFDRRRRPVGGPSGVGVPRVLAQHHGGLRWFGRRARLTPASRATAQPVPDVLHGNAVGDSTEVRERAASALTPSQRGGVPAQHFGQNVLPEVVQVSSAKAPRGGDHANGLVQNLLVLGKHSLEGRTGRRHRHGLSAGGKVSIGIDVGQRQERRMGAFTWECAPRRDRLRRELRSGRTT